MRRVFFVAALLFPILALAAPPTTVILVRHAEKSGPTGDVPLSEAGFERAKELARVFSGTKLDAIYTTPFHRTRQTVQPLAKLLGVELREVKTGQGYAQEMAEIVRKQHGGQTVLIAGHSNSTVDVLRALGVKDPPKIEDSQYDDLFVVTLAEGETPKLLALRYGAVTR